MRKVSTLLASLLIGCALAASAQSTPDRAGRIEHRLDTLAASFAKALGDRPVREFVRQSIAASETGTEVRLRDLLDRAPRNAKSGTLGTAEGRAALLRLLGNTPDVDVSVLPSLAAWKAATGEAPVVAYTWEGAGPEERQTVRAFDGAGNLIAFDARQPLDRPVVLLEVHDNRGSAQAPSVPAHAAKLPAKDFGSCSDSTTYSSYPLITSSAIWDAHESSLNGPKGFLYFASAGSEKTGNLPASLGGLSGWATNVWASNFQGPISESNTRMQWEWTADGWLQVSTRSYPALFCQQSASTPGGLTLATYTIKEDDDALNPDDYVGKFQVDHSRCKADVFDQGIENGWTWIYTSNRIDDINDVSYKLYCQTQRQCIAETTCPDGTTLLCSGGGTCGAGNCESGSDYVRCGGTYKYCQSTNPCPRGQIICDPL